MKHSSSTHFSGIPIDTNTLAGQWMTFSHMANHYRKLLNVKPRVDTGLPPNHSASHHGSFHNFSSLNNSSKMPSSKSAKSMGMGSTNTNRRSLNYSNAKSSTNGDKSLCYQSIRRNNVMYSSHPEHLNISGKPSPAFAQAKESIGKAKAVIEKSKCINKNTKGEKKQTPTQVLNYPDYQVVFGPSSIRSSTDAFLSDETDSTVSGDNKPPSEVQAPLGVSEKIRHFLNNIHQLDLKPSSLKKKRAKAVTGDQLAIKSKSTEVTGRPIFTSPTPVSIPPSLVSSSTNQIDSRLSRHSRCFLPYEPNNNCSNPKSPKKCQSQKGGATSSSCAVTPTKCNKKSTAGNTVGSPMLHLNRKSTKQKLSLDLDESQSKSSRLARNRFSGSGMDMYMLPEKDVTSTGRNQGKNRKRTESATSIGTICGSEELTPEDFPMNLQDIYSKVGRDILEDDVLLSKILDDNIHLLTQSKRSSTRLTNSSHHHHHHHHNHNHRHNNSSGVSSVSTNMIKSSSITSLIPEGGRSSGGASRSKTSIGASHHNNNKDSSRDSAYGFSSGESRITTRESTPEKKCLDEYNETGDHLMIHADFLDEPCKELEPSSSHHYLKQKSSKNAIEVRSDSSDKYLTFLTELTQDIVSQGIYTNKGLKTLFKARLDQTRHLNQDKLSDMLERLRTDLGIPKDDALDKIEFGYGSVANATSTTFFYSPPSPNEKLSTESVIENVSTVTSSSNVGDILLEEYTISATAQSSASPSPTTIIPCMPPTSVTNTTTTTTTGFSSSGGPNTSSNRSSTTTDEGSGDLFSVPGSDDNQVNNMHDDDDDEDDEDEDIEGGFYEDELSLSETEVTEALRIAGLNDAIAEEVVGMLKN